MPRSKKPYTPPYGQPRDTSQEKPQFFSEKFRKSDKERVDQLDKANPSWWVEALEKMPLDWSISVKWSEQNECFQCTISIPLKAEGTNRKGLLIGRGATKVGSMVVAAYWYTTLPLAELFPADDVDDEALF